MPRMGRIVLPNYLHHVVQRGHNRQIVFAGTEDYQCYLANLRKLKEAFGVKVYAYCLMTNHVHLLLAPGDASSGLGQMMKGLAARMMRYRNRLEWRSGTLWESRYKSSVVQSDSYLLACCRYIELNPVRAGMVADPADYPWSSYQTRGSEMEDGRWLDADPCFVALGNTAIEWCHRYEAFVRQTISADEIRVIRDALQRGQLTGTSRFVEEAERITGLRIENRGQGRPRGNPEK